MSKRKSGPLFFKPARTASAKNQPADVDATIERLSAEGRGMAFHNGKPLFIANTLPGETVRARITFDKREYAEAELREIITPAAQRMAPHCELFGRCGGCALQMLDYDAQLQHKSQVLARLLKAHVDALAEPLLAAPWHYRHRARFAVADNHGQPVLGFKAANSHRVIAVSACAILDERLQSVLTQLPHWLQQLTQWRRIEEIRLAVDSAGKIALAWNAKRSLPAGDVEKMTQLCAEAGVICDSHAELTYRVPSQRTAFQFSLHDFTQVNPAINDQLVARALAWLQPELHGRVADFFCGLGNFSLPLAQRAQHVVGYEFDAAMVKRAAANAAGLTNLEFRAADLYAADAAVVDAYDAALLDPPRAGAKALCERLAQMQSLQRIVYVSCNPQTLIRDIDILARGGFRVERAALVDMFPQTGHIEAIALLSRVQLNRNTASSKI